MTEEDWKSSESYRFGIDLFNAGYWWECHEELEGLWHAVGHETPIGQFLQGIIQIAAALLQESLGSRETAAALAGKGLEKLDQCDREFLGVDVPRFSADVRRHFEGIIDPPVRIGLRGISS